MSNTNKLVSFIESHPCYRHHIFDQWIEAEPDSETIGALFHQIRSFCDATRPGGNMPEALQSLGFDHGSHLMQEIVESEEDHGPELASMAALIVKSANSESPFDQNQSTNEIEAFLKSCSDKLLGNLPGYDFSFGLMPQTIAARNTFNGRMKTDLNSTYRNLGVALALEIISHRHLIPGEKKALIDSGLYGVTIDDDAMHYLLEHWGECGAEAHHEQNAIDAVASLVNEDSYPFMLHGAQEFLDNLCSVWDMLSNALLSNAVNKAA